MTDLSFSPALFFILTGVILLILGPFLWRKQRSLKNSLQALNSITEAAGISPYQISLPLLRKEIARVRRYQHPLSLIVIKPREYPVDRQDGKPGGLARKENGSGGNAVKQLGQIEFLLCGRILRDSLREFDIISYDGANNRFVICLPESAKENAEKAVARLNDIIGKRISSQISHGIAEFPGDGLIIEDLVERAMESVNAYSVSQRKNLVSAPQKLNPGE